MVDVWERPPEGAWNRRTLGAGQTADIEALPARLVVDDLYLAAREPVA